MINKPWIQILAFVVGANVAQAGLMLLGAAWGNELAVFMLLMFASLFCTALLVVPASATTGHKLLTLTFTFATLYFSVATIATACAMAGSALSWYIYNSIQNSFYATMQLFTALEIICIFSNAGARMGRIGEHFGRAVDYMYSSILLRALRKAHAPRV